MPVAKTVGGPMAARAWDSPEGFSGLPPAHIPCAQSVPVRSAGLVKDIAFMLMQGGEIHTKVCGVRRRSDKRKATFIEAAKTGFYVSFSSIAGRLPQASATSVMKGLYTARRILKSQGWCYISDSMIDNMEQWIKRGGQEHD